MAKIQIISENAKNPLKKLPRNAERLQGQME
jgi:hypothetical protein